nr:craniofacial development protein 2-like [Chelonoidis abingdonii]
MEEKKRIRCDILGICETQQKELEVNWKDGSTVRLGKGDGARNVGGVRFIISKDWVSKVISCQLISSRIGVLHLQMESKAILKVIQAYAPTSTSEDEEVEEFYQELKRALMQKSTYIITMGDFNAKVGRGKAGEKFIGRYGSGERNERGERLVTMAETKELNMANTWYKKKIAKRWTWIMPNVKSKNEIDYILVNKRCIVQDVSVVQPFNIGSDHRLLRVKLIFDEAVEKKALQMANRKQCLKTFDEESDFWV